jgi:NADPH-ferrihemoprotein reductase
VITAFSRHGQDKVYV